MATLILQAAGAFLGGFLGPVGAVLGTAAGAMAGYMVDRALVNSSLHYKGPRLDAMRPFTAEEGAPVPRVYGAARIGGTMIWATRFEENKKTKRQGFKGARVTTYTYFANAAFGLCEGPVAGIRRVWADGREVDLTTCDIRLHRGGETQAPDPLIEAKQGSGNAPAYRGTAYVVIDRFPLDDYGNRVPQFQFEVLRPVGDFHERIRAITLIPGATTFGLSLGWLARLPLPGVTESENRHVLHAASDLEASLDELAMLCPNLKHVALVVAWFGDDLDAARCKIYPAVTTGLAAVTAAWSVGGVGSDAARMVSTHEGVSAYGGTPADTTVIGAICAIRDRGWEVTLYPFVMMDVPADNALSDPYGGARQAAYPWRGRITVDPAPGREDTPDKTAQARDAVAAFAGAAEAGDFSVSTGMPVHTGPASDEGYRRFILHCAHLAALAGGVDAFLVGSELRGLTTLRDGANAYPFVETLIDLAAEVRSVLGTGTKITYGADWSEYFGHQPADGSGDVHFHLDPLWASADIDAVGIDNYMPLSDWRDEDWGGGNPDGATAPYDRAALRRGIASGEGFDWHYADDAARRARLRTPISDGAGKPWLFRNKDLVSWWSNPHFDRPGGVESAVPTAWVPQSKPLWLTELGCAAVDKAPNQPNVFPDTKSSENALPYFSDGGRSDLAQRRFIEAHLDHWDADAAGFSAAANPVSPLYGGRMVDRDRIYLWTWDARPYPAFPRETEVWADGPNWLTGHWLTGRLTHVTAGDLIAAILADHGFEGHDARGADGMLHGYVLAEPASARRALEPLLELFDIGAAEENGTLVFRSGGATGAALAVEDPIAAGDGEAGLERRRQPDHELPSDVMLTFLDPVADYQSGAARAVEPTGAGGTQAGLSLAAAMETGLAEALAADWLARAWTGRDTIRFAVPAAQRAPRAGGLVTLPGRVDGEHVVVAIEDGLVRRIEARRVRRVAPAPDRARLASRTPPVSVQPGSPLARLLDLPLMEGTAEEDQLRVAIFAKPWRSQVVFASPAVTGYTERTVVEAMATLGVLATALAPGVEGRIDHVGAVEVTLSSGELASVDMAQMLNGANTAAIRSVTGVWEIAQFMHAEEVAASRWRLGGLVRGQLGTIDAARAGAATGADFVLLDGAVRPAGLRKSEIGLQLNWRIGPAGQVLGDALFAPIQAIAGLRASQPLPPAHLRAWRTGAGALEVSWIRRGRVDADSWLGVDIPLGEDREAYVVTVAPPGGVVLRRVEATSPAWTYGADAIDADFPARPATAEIVVRQVGTLASEGVPATILVTLT